MIWAGKTSLSITSTAGLEECVGKRRHENPILAIFRRRAEAREKAQQWTCKTKPDRRDIPPQD